MRSARLIDFAIRRLNVKRAFDRRYESETRCSIELIQRMEIRN
jgi:hypothetical protein